MRKLEFLSLEQSNPQPDKDKILLFMKHSPVIASSPGISKNYLTREHLATEMTVYSAFGYYWTSADIWYYEVYITTGLGYGFDYGIVRCNAGHNHTVYSLTVYDSAGINRHRATISITTCNAGIHGTQEDYNTISGWLVLWQEFLDSIR